MVAERRGMATLVAAAVDCGMIFFETASRWGATVGA
jgi:hypothetical protein